MLCWVMCWLHGHVVCDGNLMVGIWGEVGWGNRWWDGVGDHTSVTIVPCLKPSIGTTQETCILDNSEIFGFLPSPG